MKTRLKRRLRRLRRSPLTPAIGGALGGAATAGAALSIDATWRHRPEMFTVAAGQLFLSAVAGAAITVTALLLWVRGMLVQLSAGQLSNRVVRWYLEDRFLLDSIGFLIAVFSYSGLVLLAMPPEGPAPPIATALAFLLTLTALVTTVVAIADSVHATDAGMILHNLSAEARAAIRDAHPHDERHQGAPAGEIPPGRGGSHHVEFALVALRTGWVTEIDADGLLARMPGDSVLQCDVRAGSFVPEGHTIGHVSIAATLADTEAVGERVEALTRYVRIEPRRAALTYDEYLRRTFGHLRGVAADLSMLGVLVDTLGELRGVVVQGSTDARLDAIDAEAERLLDAVRRVRTPHDERQAILELAARHGWAAPELGERAVPDSGAPAPSDVDDISRRERREPESSSAG